MRLSSLSFSAVLLLSSIVFAQHSGSAPAAPAPSAAPGVSSSAPNVGVFHTSAPNPPANVNVPESRVAPSSGSTVSRGSISSPAESRSGLTATAPMHDPRSDPGRLIPDQKVPGESKIVSAPRIWQYSPGKEPEMKPGPPGLRHRICGNEPCKEKGTEWKADPPRTDLRRRVCVTGPCPCAPGQTTGKGGCIANPPVAEPLAQPFEPCQPGEIWNGAVCMPSNHCAPGEIWNGTSCIASANECASIVGRAAILVSELRALKAQIQEACGQNPPWQDCEDLKQRQGEAQQRYQMLLSEAGPGCQATLADLASLE